MRRSFAEGYSACATNAVNFLDRSSPDKPLQMALAQFLQVSLAERLKGLPGGAAPGPISGLSVAIPPPPSFPAAVTPPYTRLEAHSSSSSSSPPLSVGSPALSSPSPSSSAAFSSAAYSSAAADEKKGDGGVWRPW